MTRTRRDERGVVTSFVVVLVAALVTVALAAAAGGALLVAHRQAAAAADLGALAGAVARQHGQDGCDAVHRLVRRHEAQVQQCSVSGDQVRVTVAVDLGTLAGRDLSVAARAHAGPR